MCSSSQFQLSAHHLLCLVMQPSSFPVGILLRKFVKRRSPWSLLYKGKGRMYSKEIPCLEQIALWEVFSDKREIETFLCWKLSSRWCSISCFTVHSGVVSESGFSSFMSHCWVCLSGHDHDMQVSMACSLGGIGLACDSCSGAQDSPGSDLEEELNCCFRSKYTQSFLCLSFEDWNSFFFMESFLQQMKSSRGIKFESEAC